MLVIKEQMVPYMVWGPTKAQISFKQNLLLLFIYFCDVFLFLLFLLFKLDPTILYPNKVLNLGTLLDKILSFDLGW